MTGCHRPADGSGQSAAKSLLAALEPLGITKVDPVPKLNLGDIEKQNQLAVHPGSGSAAKNWPEDQWVGFLKAWLAQGRGGLVIVGGEAEVERVERLSAALPRASHRVLLHAPLTEVAQVLASSRAFVGHDSGITHLAAAVGLPGVVLWTHTDATVWRPPNVTMQLLPQPIAPHAVLEAVTTYFD